MLEPILRLVVSLAVVVGLLLVTMRVARRTMRSRPGALVRVVQRQSLTRSTGLAVVEVGGRMLVLGTTEHQVSLLAELDEEVAEPAAAQAGPQDPDGPDGPGDPALDGTATVIDLRGRSRSSAAPHLQAAAAVETADEEQEQAGFAAELSTALEREQPGTPAPDAHRGRRRATPTTRPASATGPLAGSVLSPGTWRQAVAAVRGGR